MLKVIKGGRPPRRPRREPKEKVYKTLQQPCEIIQAALKVKGITRKQLAEEADISLSLVYGMVSGKRVCRDYAEELEKALDIPKGRLLEMERALTFQAQKKYSDLIDQLRDETRDLAERSFRSRRHLQLLDENESP